MVLARGSGVPLNAHSDVAIAQTIFYVPAVPLAMYIMRRNAAKHSARLWWPLVPLTLMRFAGGPVLLALEHYPDNIGLIIAAIILLNVGVVPLLVQSLNLFRIVLMGKWESGSIYRRLVRAMFFAFVPAIGCLAAGGGVASVDPHTGRILTLVGYCVFAGILVALVASELHLWKTSSTVLDRESRMILLVAFMAVPFLVVRNAYGIIYVLNEDHMSKWNPLYGSAALFATMGLLMEYIVICAYFYIGLSVDPTPRSRGIV